MSDTESYASDFWSKVQIGARESCWPWAASKRGEYGRYRGRQAHRFAWELNHGTPVPADRMILHSCDNPPCCNPAHLRVGTARDNFHDMVARGREAKNWRRWAPRAQALKARNKRVEQARQEMMDLVVSGGLTVKIPRETLQRWIDVLEYPKRRR